jgi:hypothetical protein
LRPTIVSAGAALFKCAISLTIDVLYVFKINSGRTKDQHNGAPMCVGRERYRVHITDKSDDPDCDESTVRLIWVDSDSFALFRIAKLTLKLLKVSP